MCTPSTVASKSNWKPKELETCIILKGNGFLCNLHIALAREDKTRYASENDATENQFWGGMINTSHTHLPMQGMDINIYFWLTVFLPKILIPSCA